ncbi:hypothetical protein ACVIIW_004360 [Bradyrhizobium sp. USDA 4449]
MPLASSNGWFGCSRVLIRPFRPMVLRKAVVTSHLRAARIRSWLRISFDTAAAISGVMPGASLRKVSGLAASESSQSRKAPTVSEETCANALLSWLSITSRVTSSVS